MITAPATLWRTVAQELQTVTSRTNLITHLDELKQQLSSTNDPPTVLEENLTAAEYRAVHEFITETKPSDIAVGLSTFRQELLKLTPLQLTTAFSPSPELVERIYNKLAEHIADAFLLDFAVDPSIGGGLIVSYEGRWVDHSVRAQIAKLASALVPN